MEIQGINYKIDWENFKMHTTFWVPCLDVGAAEKAIRAECRRKKITVTVMRSVENGFLGVRVWRVPKPA